MLDRINLPPELLFLIEKREELERRQKDRRVDSLSITDQSSESSAEEASPDKTLQDDDRRSGTDRRQQHRRT